MHLSSRLPGRALLQLLSLRLAANQPVGYRAALFSSAPAPAPSASSSSTNAVSAPSSLRLRLRADLKSAMQAKDKTRTDVVKSLLSALVYADKESGVEVGDDGAIRVLLTAIKRREESITEFKAGKRPDLVEKEEAELAEIRKYLPEQMTREEITAAVRAAIEKTGAKSAKDMRAVMDAVALDPLRAPKRIIAEIAKELMSSSTAAKS